MRDLNDAGQLNGFLFRSDGVRDLFYLQKQTIQMLSSELVLFMLFVLKTHAKVLFKCQCGYHLSSQL